MRRLILGDRSARKSASPQWIKSSLSQANGSCVEVASMPGGGIGVRDSKNIKGAVLRFTPDEWDAFLGGVREGEFDRFSQFGRF